MISDPSPDIPCSSIRTNHGRFGESIYHLTPIADRLFQASANKTGEPNAGNQNRPDIQTSPGSDNNENTPSTFGPAAGIGLVFPDTGRAKEQANRVIGLFRDLSRLCNQATQDVEDHAREERKLKAYTELSTTLSKVSATAASPVMPTLAEILLKHAECKQRVDDNFKSIAGVWAEIFDIFAVEISDVMDAKLGDTLKTIRQEAESVYGNMATASATKNLKRQRNESMTPSGDGGMEGNAEKVGSLADDGCTTRGQKRRRFDTASRSFSPERQKNWFTQTGMQSQSGDPSEIQMILSQMKSKIDEQAGSLQRLTRENDELKATLHQQASNLISKGSRPRSTISTSQARVRRMNSGLGILKGPSLADQFQTNAMYP